jgi:hypothetical protein
MVGAFYNQQAWILGKSSFLSISLAGHPVLLRQQHSRNGQIRFKKRDHMAYAIRIYETGKPEVLRYEEVSVGNPGPGEARVRHVAVGLNFADTYFRNGT